LERKEKRKILCLFPTTKVEEGESSQLREEKRMMLRGLRLCERKKKKEKCDEISFLTHLGQRGRGGGGFYPLFTRKEVRHVDIPLRGGGKSRPSARARVGSRKTPVNLHGKGARRGAAGEKDALSSG